MLIEEHAVLREKASTREVEMMGQNEKALNEDDIKSMMEDIFEHSLVDKIRLRELWKIISDRYI